MLIPDDPLVIYNNFTKRSFLIGWQINIRYSCKNCSTAPSMHSSKLPHQVSEILVSRGPGNICRDAGMLGCWDAGMLTHLVHVGCQC